MVNFLLDGVLNLYQDIEYLEENEVQYGDVIYSVQLNQLVLETY